MDIMLLNATNADTLDFAESLTIPQLFLITLALWAVVFIKLLRFILLVYKCFYEKRSCCLNKKEESKEEEE